MNIADKAFYDWFPLYLEEWSDSPGQQDEIRRMRDQFHDCWREAWDVAYSEGWDEGHGP